MTIQIHISIPIWHPYIFLFYLLYSAPYFRARGDKKRFPPPGFRHFREKGPKLKVGYCQFQTDQGHNQLRPWDTDSLSPQQEQSMFHGAYHLEMVILLKWSQKYATANSKLTRGITSLDHRILIALFLSKNNLCSMELTNLKW